MPGSGPSAFLRPNGDPVVKARVEAVLPELAVDDVVWERAYELTRLARSAGVSVPVTDILSAACARRHGAELETADAYFERLVGL